LKAGVCFRLRVAEKSIKAVLLRNMLKDETIFIFTVEPVKSLGWPIQSLSPKIHRCSYVLQLAIGKSAQFVGAQVNISSEDAYGASNSTLYARHQFESDCWVAYSTLPV
jgi:hypothetical protein